MTTNPPPTPVLPTPEDVAWYLLFAYASMAGEVYLALRRHSQAYEKSAIVRKKLDQIQRTGANFYSALRTIEDHFLSFKPDEAMRGSVKQIAHLITEAHNAVLSCPPEKLNQLADMLACFKDGSYRALDSGVYEALEHAPLEPDGQILHLVEHFCPDIQEHTRRQFAVAIAQLGHYQVKTEEFAKE